MTGTEFNRFRSELTDVILGAVEASGRCFPIILTIDDKGKKGSVEVPPEMLAIPIVKEMFFASVKANFKRLNIVAMCFASECYMLQLEKMDDFTDDYKKKGISDHPKRVEVVNLQFQTKTEVHITSFRIEREPAEGEDNEGNIKALIPYFDKGGDSMKDMGGMFAGFLS